MAEWTVTWASQGIMAKTPEIQITEVSTVEGTIESLQSQGSVKRKEKVKIEQTRIKLSNPGNGEH